uniref:Putative licpodalin-4 1 n=1 Tax=Amblyomma triste TaxID=251400 RepID=A0A023GAJ6_AMBTT
MFALAVCVSLLVVVSGTETEPAPYEEECDHFSEQKIMDMVEIKKPLYVKLRNYETRTQYGCHSIQNVGQLLENVYRYKMRARDKRYHNYTEYYINSTLWKSGWHTEYNAANYTEHDKNVTVKLMTRNENKTCFILVKYSAEDKKQCDLLMTKETVRERIPQWCGEIYKKHCTNYTEYSVELWKESCSTDFVEELPSC